MFFQNKIIYNLFTIQINTITITCFIIYEKNINRQWGNLNIQKCNHLNQNVHKRDQHYYMNYKNTISLNDIIYVDSDERKTVNIHKIIFLVL